MEEQAVPWANLEEREQYINNKTNNMKKKLIIGIIIIIILVLVGGVIVYSGIGREYISKLTPEKKDNYQYKSEELKKMSEEAGINLEKGMVEQPEQEETLIYEKQKEETLISRNTPIYIGKLIINEANNKEWTVRVGIPTEVDKKYGIWKQEKITNPSFIGELTSSSYGAWEYKSEGNQELKGGFYIGTIGVGNIITDTFYTIQK